MLPLSRRLGGDTALLGDPGPDPAGGPQLGDRRELVGGRGVAEFQLRERRVGGKPGRLHRPQVLEARSEGAAELLRVGTAGLVVGQRVDDDRADCGEVVRAASGEADGSGQTGGGEVSVVWEGCGGEVSAVWEGGGGRAGQTGLDAGPRQHSERVGPQAAGQRAWRHPPAGGDVEVHLRRLGEPRAGVEDDRRQVEVGLREYVGQRLDRDPAVAEAQPERADAALEVLHDLLAGDGRVGVLVTLPDVPSGAVAGRPAPAHERRLPGVAGDGRAAVGDVERLDLDAVGGDGREPPFRGLDVGVDPQHLGDQALPLLPGDGGEFGRQHQVVGARRGDVGHARDRIARIRWLRYGLVVIASLIGHLWAKWYRIPFSWYRIPRHGYRSHSRSVYGPRIVCRWGAVG